MVEVAILLTTYNSAEYLVSLLDSIKGQSYKNCNARFSLVIAAG